MLRRCCSGAFAPTGRSNRRARSCRGRCGKSSAASCGSEADLGYNNCYAVECDASAICGVWSLGKTFPLPDETPLLGANDAMLCTSNDELATGSVAFGLRSDTSEAERTRPDASRACPARDCAAFWLRLA